MICSRKGSVYAVSVNSGECRLLVTVDGETFSSPGVAAGKLIIGCRDNNVYCFETAASSTASDVVTT